MQNLIEELLPVATVVTPNIPEAQVLSGLTIETKEDMVTAAKQIGDHYHCAVLLKGGHSINDANDLLYASGESVWFEGKRIHNPNTWHRLYPLQRHSIQPRQGIHPCRIRTESNGLYLLCFGSNA